MGLDASVLVASLKRRGEKYHPHALALAETVSMRGHVGVCSALVLTEVPGALASTSMPVDMIYVAETSLLAGFRVSVRPFEQYADRAVDMMLEFRDLKREFGIGSADFHHLATASGEGCGMFVTTDEKHMLRKECKEAFSDYVPVRTPAEAVKALSSG